MAAEYIAMEDWVKKYVTELLEKSVTPFFNYIASIPHTENSAQRIFSVDGQKKEIAMTLTLSGTGSPDTSGSLTSMLIGPFNFAQYVAAGYKNLSFNVAKSDSRSVTTGHVTLFKSSTSDGDVTIGSTLQQFEVGAHKLNIEQLLGTYYMRIYGKAAYGSDKNGVANKISISGFDLS